MQHSSLGTFSTSVALQLPYQVHCNPLQASSWMLAVMSWSRNPCKITFCTAIAQGLQAVGKHTIEVCNDRVKLQQDPALHYSAADLKSRSSYFIAFISCNELSKKVTHFRSAAESSTSQQKFDRCVLFCHCHCCTSCCVLVPLQQPACSQDVPTLPTS